MSDDRRNNDSRPPDGDAARALAILARLPRSSAPESARESARMAFLHGSVVERLDQADSTETDSTPRRSSRRWVNLLMAAALGVLAVVWFGYQPEQAWTILDVQSPGGIAVQGDRTLAVGDRVISGDLATGPESELEIQLGDKLRFRMLPGTSLNLPKPPGRWFGNNRRLHLDSGEIYGTSGGNKLGFDLVFSTDELEARLTGTTFAVFRTDITSCVCLWDGGIAVTPLVGGHGVISLEELSRVWIYKDGRAPEIAPLDAMETMKLQMTHDGGLADLPGQDE
jgi:ferric-dicitrate binding protein FerR (iron transport regulator)